MSPPRPPTKKELNLRWIRFGFSSHSGKYTSLCLVLSLSLFFFFLTKSLVDPNQLFCTRDGCPSRLASASVDQGLVIAYSVVAGLVVGLCGLLLWAPGVLMDTPQMNKVLAMVSLLLLLVAGVCAAVPVKEKRYVFPAEMVFPYYSVAPHEGLEPGSITVAISFRNDTGNGTGAPPLPRAFTGAFKVVVYETSAGIPVDLEPTARVLYRGNKEDGTAAFQLPTQPGETRSLTLTKVKGARVGRRAVVLYPTDNRMVTSMIDQSTPTLAGDAGEQAWLDARIMKLRF
jgi:hypothetical protein